MVDSMWAGLYSGFVLFKPSLTTQTWQRTATPQTENVLHWLTFRKLSCTHNCHRHGKLKVRFISSKPGYDRHDSPAHRWEYVKQFEQPDQLLPNTWIVVRIDGRGFTK